MGREGDHSMRVLLLLGAVALALSGCAGLSVAKPVPEPLSVTFKAMADAGCTIQFNIDVGGATGQLGGGFHANNIISGGCDPSKAAKPLIAAGGSFGGGGATITEAGKP